MDDLKSSGFLTTDIINPITNEKMTGCVLYKWDEGSNQYIFRYDEECNAKVEYVDASGANKPKLYNNMIPVRYDGNNWVYADLYEKWYDYSNKEWANAIVLNSGVTKNVGDIITEDEIALWYVWIPRYTYTMFNGNNNEAASEQLIEVQFESGTNSSGTVNCVDAVVGVVLEENQRISQSCYDETNKKIINGTSTYTHPAFTFGDKELTGFWVGKFEISTTDTTCNNSVSSTNCNKVLPIAIKPGVSSFRYATLSNFFNSIKGIETEYGINADSHVIKNMEWGAVAYLKQSQYGLGITDIEVNNSSSFITGGGTSVAYKTNTNQSPTGNIYGVYDMSGNAYEYTMTTMVSTSGGFNANGSGFTSEPESKYLDKYSYGDSSTSYIRGKLGDATKETLATLGSSTGGWYSNYFNLFWSGSSWLLRGGYSGSQYSGLFNSYGGSTGTYDSRASTRAILS